MVGIFIYVDGEPYGIELFKDESISITSSIQNFRDLGKIFTDYSKSFTVPASAINNQIFKHWYNSEVGSTSTENPINVDGAFDHRISYYGYLEVDGAFFRNGKFVLKGTKKKDNKIESYTINFVGNLIQLKERFKDDKLNSLSTIISGVRVSLYKQLNHLWQLSEVQARVTGGAAYDILYPLIGTKRKLFLNSGVAAQDISTTTGKLKFDEIFPALRVSKILEYIQSTYGITFQGAFIQSQTFSKLYLYLKNQNELVVKSQQVMVDFTSKQDFTQVISNDTNPSNSSNRSAYKFNDLDLDSNVLTFDTDYAPFFFPYTSLPQSWRYRSLSLTITVTAGASNPYNLFVYNNGVLYSTFENIVGSTTKIIFANKGFGWSSSDDDFSIYNFTFFVSSDSGITFTTTLEQRITVLSSQSYTSFGSPTILTPTQIQISRGFSAAQSTVSNIDIQSFIPDITVTSFIEGLIKMFNLMVIPTGETSFYLHSLNDYYNDGTNWDITEYVNPEDISIDPPQLYKKVEFKYQNSENALNSIYRGLYNKEYGDLNFENINSAFNETYTVELPFEDFMFDRETGTDFITATIFNSDGQPYVPKPSFIYCNGLQNVTPSIKIADNTTTNTITNYTRFSNELPLAGSDFSYVQSLNWGAEYSAWDLNINFVGLYEKFYASYIRNLFNQRTRILKTKAILPNSIVSFLQLKDKIILSNKRYIINTMTIDLTSKETNFELISDSSPPQTLEDTQILRLSNVRTLNLDNTAQEIELQIFLKDNDLWRSKVAAGFLFGTYTSGGNVYEDGLLTVNVPANTTGLDRQDEILIEYYKGSTFFIFKIPVTQNA